MFRPLAKDGGVFRPQGAVAYAWHQCRDPVAQVTSGSGSRILQCKQRQRVTLSGRGLFWYSLLILLILC